VEPVGHLLTADPDANGAIEVGWDAVSGATTYVVGHRVTH
jgi:hypothetical protein